MISDLLRESGVALDTSDEWTLTRAAAAVGVAAAAGIGETAEEVAEALGRYHPDIQRVLPWRPGAAGASLTATVLAALWDESGGDWARLAIDLDATPDVLQTLENLLRYALPAGSATLVDYTGGPGVAPVSWTPQD